MELNIPVNTHWRKSFAHQIRFLLDPNSDLSKRHPHLHHILARNADDALHMRGGKPISQCTHKIKRINEESRNSYSLGRSDGPAFQKNENSEIVNQLWAFEDTVEHRYNCLCTDLLDRMEIYGYLGSGTFAAVFLARDKTTSSWQARPEDVNHYAVKVQRHETVLGAVTSGRPTQPMIAIEEVSSTRYIPNEALILLLLTHSDRFPMLDSVYTHDRFHAIVMSPCIDPSPERNPGYPGSMRRVFPAFTGKYLMNKNKTPLLDEMQACKVAAQLLEGIVHMADMNLWHTDLSVNNFCVDQNLNVQIIDLGETTFGLKDHDFRESEFYYIPYQEYQVFPEVAEQLLEIKSHNYDSHNAGLLPLTHDVREEAIWKYGVIVYGILHGYWPWEEVCHFDLLRWKPGHHDDIIDERRMRMVRYDVPINESLSQGCRDVLRRLLSRDPRNRPSLDELITFPWFSQWSRANRLYERPFSHRFQNSYFRSAGM
ncbi:hypothetical protein N7495_005955 [Penicillium taxi]|uniref:uncharacterized protein n=1 Tax=Penicillium taxi TaxID=168475 RepID=UPI002545B567|nr:uncharacterized protein N7495_005955 [Penicillium taxi]KAJ5894264.1 hypothetical protein N7495_005955 [Penicillium taxi]